MDAAEFRQLALSFPETTESAPLGVPVRHWKQALNQFAIPFEDHMPELASKLRALLG